MLNLSSEEKQLITELSIERPSKLWDFFLKKNPYDKIEGYYIGREPELLDGYKDEQTIFKNIKILQDSLDILERNNYIKIIHTKELVDDFALVNNQNQEISRELQDALIKIYNTSLTYNESLGEFVNQGFITKNEHEEKQEKLNRKKFEVFTRRISIASIVIAVLALIVSAVK